MQRWFSLLMLVGALLGLMGQEAAFANVLSAQKVEQVTATAQMSPECAQMMGLAQQKPQSDQPCNGMTPECIAKMGCAVPLALLPPFASGVSREFREDTPPQMPVSPLLGRDTGPEPEPPARLG